MGRHCREGNFTGGGDLVDGKNITHGENPAEVMFALIAVGNLELYYTVVITAAKDFVQIITYPSLTNV